MKSSVWLVIVMPSSVQNLVIFPPIGRGLVDCRLSSSLGFRLSVVKFVEASPQRGGSGRVLIYSDLRGVGAPAVERRVSLEA